MQHKRESQNPSDDATDFGGAATEVGRQIELQWNVLAELPFFPLIDDELRTAKADYDRARGPIEQRAALNKLLEAIMAFINLHVPWRRAKIAGPLHDLVTGFQSLDAGAVEPLLAANKPRGRPVVQSWALVRAYAAAASATHMLAGESEHDADGLVASYLQEAGYKKPKGDREDGRLITRQTVRAWRKEARERPTDHVVRSTYEWLTSKPGKRLVTEPPFDRDDEPRKKAQRILSILTQRAPPPKM